MKFGHVMIRVRNLKASMDFYREVIGLRELRRREIGDEATLVMLSDDDRDYQVELTYNKDGRDYVRGNQFGHLAFTCDDLQKVIAEVERRQLPYRRCRPELQSKYIFVKDPDGYDVEILQR